MKNKTKTEQSIPSGVKWLQEEVWRMIGLVVLRVVKELIEELLKVEVKEVVQADHYERTKKRKGYRNGYYERDLVTSFGFIEALKVPRVREGDLHLGPLIHTAGGLRRWIVS